MQGSLLLGLLLLGLLTWDGHADRHAHLKRLQLRRRARQGGRAGAQPSAADRERLAGGRAHPGFNSAISVHGAQREAPRRRGGAAVGQLGLPPPAAAAADLLLQDEGAPGARARVARMPSSAGSPNLLASFAGKNRVLVISAPHDSDGYYRLMMSLLKPDVYCELAERHVHQIVMFHQEGELGGKVRRVSAEGKVMEEPLDTALIPRLMSFLKLEKGQYCGGVAF